MRTLLLSLVLLLVVPSSFAQLSEEPDPLPTIAEATDGMEQRDGFVPIYWDARRGKVWLEISRFDEDLLYVSYLAAGLGSNPVGLDRGQLSGERVVRFERVGPKVMLVQPNLNYRAPSDNPAEQEAVEEAFASSVVYGFEVAAEDDDGRVLVDATDFILRDVHGIVRTLKRADQGTYTLDKSRSAPYLPSTKSFPQNTELEARLTFTTDEQPGGYVRGTAADPYAVTLRIRHSLVALTDREAYSPRRSDPRAGFYAQTYRDYAVPIGEEIPQRLIARHRLVCASDPDAEGMCEPEEPIVYYLDRGTPEPVRSALLDGARWWNEAFEEAGFRDAFRVEMLPDEADPMDVRYNVIQWVHRRTRGWSYGASVWDPRTGEILKGHVTLGSLRVRQDYLLAEGLLAPYVGPNANGFDENDPMLDMSLARIRQLSAHEIGHTIGLRHNFAASTNERASVMDYPAPLAAVQGDSISLANAYDVGIGEWDIHAIRYGYGRPGEGQSEAEFLEAAIQARQDAGLRYITDADARPAGAAHPYANLWDNGSNMIASLEREMDVRRVAMQRFGGETIRKGQPLAVLEEVLVPLYLRHRYQVQATTKLIGGVTYTYAVRGDDNATLPTPVPSGRQMDALGALLATLSPEALRLPETALDVLPPRPPGYPSNRELFPGRTGLTLDAYAPAEVAASMVLSGIIHPERAERLMQQKGTDDDQLGLQEVLRTVSGRVWRETDGDDMDADLKRTVQRVWVDVLIETATNASTSPSVKATLEQHLRRVRQQARDVRGDDREKAHRARIRSVIDRYLDRDYARADDDVSRLETPPGSPIGAGDTPWARQNARSEALEAWSGRPDLCRWHAH
ncbi:hypothetical protein CRI94_10750 [Longibacter salinarum]|uniref:Peptidase n=1 Tax=Longibacter salinarum TaxID=1850348 RepID=A0A2A8CWY4_9BACT|nr:zinc-dependent metalloprotease [Longibacter salinarum]PEN13120.1 hypothetical protein CRI94_10750 [Longibacter salinarum]